MEQMMKCTWQEVDTGSLRCWKRKSGNIAGSGSERSQADKKGFCRRHKQTSGWDLWAPRLSWVHWKVNFITNIKEVRSLFVHQIWQRDDEADVSSLFNQKAYMQVEILLTGFFLYSFKLFKFHDFPWLFPVFHDLKYTCHFWKLSKSSLFWGIFWHNLPVFYFVLALDTCNNLHTTHPIIFHDFPVVSGKIF